MKTVTFRIEGMNCDGCAETLKGLIEKMADRLNLPDEVLNRTLKNGHRVLPIKCIGQDSI